MIIRYPTGLYTAVLPHKPADAGDVTFTISSTAPPRTSLLFPKIPPGVSNRPRSPKVIDLTIRRRYLGDLVFTVNRVSRVANGTSLKAYEVGQLLNFGDVQSARTLSPYTGGTASEIRHDTGLLDYDRLGFTAEQQAVVATESGLIYRARELELAHVRTLYSNLQVAIVENQKLLTETGKALDALTAMGSADPTIISMISSLTHKKQLLNSQRGGLINDANAVGKNATAILNSLQNLAQVVR